MEDSNWIVGNLENALRAWNEKLSEIFVVGVVKTCGSFSEARRPEAAFKLFIRFVLAKTVVT